jgi:hypothetical protein
MSGCTVHTWDAECTSHSWSGWPNDSNRGHGASLSARFAVSPRHAARAPAAAWYAHDAARVTGAAGATGVACITGVTGAIGVTSVTGVTGVTGGRGARPEAGVSVAVVLGAPLPHVSSAARAPVFSPGRPRLPSHASGRGPDGPRCSAFAGSLRRSTAALLRLCVARTI